MARKQVSRTQVKINYAKRLFAELTKVQNGQSASTMTKLMRNINAGLDSPDFEERKLAQDSTFKILPYVLPRESSGSDTKIQINNNTSTTTNNIGAGEEAILSLEQFLKLRGQEIEQVEDNRDKKKDERLKLTEVKRVEK